MADQMMRIAGRGDDGSAKAIKTDNKGNVGIKFNGRKAPEYSLISSATLTAGTNSTFFDLGIDGTESEVYVLFEANKSNWSVRTRGYPWEPSAAYTFGIFPRRLNETKTTTSSATPITSLLVGLPHLRDPLNFGDLNTLEDAKALSGLLTPGISLRIENGSTEDLIYKIKIIKYWK